MEKEIKKLMRDDIIIIERNKEKALLAGCDSSVFYSALHSSQSSLWLFPGVKV